jgi:hypothetical protein
MGRRRRKIGRLRRRFKREIKGRRRLGEVLRV